MSIAATSEIHNEEDNIECPEKGEGIKAWWSVRENTLADLEGTFRNLPAGFIRTRSDYFDLKLTEDKIEELAKPGTYRAPKPTTRQKKKVIRECGNGPEDQTTPELSDPTATLASNTTFTETGTRQTPSDAETGAQSVENGAKSATSAAATDI